MFVTERLRDLCQYLPGSDHDTQIGSLVSYHISKLSAGAQNSAQICQMARHAAEIELCNSAIQPLKTGCFAHLDTPRLNRFGNTLDLRMGSDPSVVLISFIN